MLFVKNTINRQNVEEYFPEKYRSVQMISRFVRTRSTIMPAIQIHCFCTSWAKKIKLANKKTTTFDEY